MTPSSSNASPSADPGAATDAAVQQAVDRLAELTSYAFELRGGTVGEPESVARGTVVNRPTAAARTEIESGGEVYLSIVTVGDRGWQSFAGSDYAEQTGEDLEGIRGSAMEDFVGQAGGAFEALQEAGPEERNGIPAIHHVSDRPIAPPPEIGLVGAGRLDLWVAAEGGHLVGGRLQLVRDPAPQGVIDPQPFETILEVAITRIDDPANTVVEPPAPGPSPSAIGDPPLVPVVSEGFRKLGALESYRLTSTASIGNRPQSVIATTVVNRPTAAAESVVTSPGSPDFPPIWTVVYDDDVYSRQGKDPYEPGGSCGSGAAPAGDTCSFATLSGQDDPSLASIAPTFTVVSESDPIDGYPARHLRSTAGLHFGQGGIERVPGTTDVWIAAEGHVLRYTFDGRGYDVEQTVSFIDSPENQVQDPATGG